MKPLTEEQKGVILNISRQAQNFLLSDLYKYFEKWVRNEQQLATNAIVLDSREEYEKQLTRESFVERKCSYYLALSTILSVFKGYAAQESELKKQNEPRTK